MTDFETPMGNTELRLSLANIEGEVAEVKGIAIETHEQAVKTNGRVNWLEKCMWGALGALPILTGLTGWLAIDYLNHRDRSATPEAIQAAVASGIHDAIEQTKQDSLKDNN